MALINYYGLVDPARIIHPAVSPLWIYCVSGDGRCWWILFSRGSPGSSRGGELYSRMMVGGSLSLWSRGAWGATVATGESGGPAQCRGRKVEPRVLRGPAQRTTHNTRLHILRTRQNTAAHTEEHTVWGRISCSSCASAGCVHVRSNKTPADQYWER